MPEAGAAARREPRTFPDLAIHEAGSGPSFVLFHGGVGSWTHWICNVEVLAATFRVLAFDSPGYGNSPDVPDAMAPSEYIDWVCDGVSRAAPDGCHLGGFSFGGALAARVAARLGRQITRLSLLGPGGLGMPVGRVIPMAKQPGPDSDLDARRAVAASNLGQWMLSTAPRTDDPIVDMQLANIDRMRFDSRRISLKATLTEDLAKITAPVQLIWGGADKLAYPSIDERVAICRQARPDVKVAVVPDGGHWVQYEQSAAVNRLLLDFHA
jgi:2-hydroxy-6-oxonona-2,4-dienedioate hydrolase